MPFSQLVYHIDSHIIHQNDCIDEVNHSEMQCYDHYLLGITSLAGVCSAAVEWATHMQMYASSSPTSVDHHEEKIEASSCSLSGVKINACLKK